MKFRTEFSAKRSSLTLNPAFPVVLTGSCFSQNIANKMRDHDWEAVNSTGTLYNPFSIAIALDMMLDKKDGDKRFEKSLFKSGDIWNSRFFDSSFSALEKDDCLEEFRYQRDVLIEALKKGNSLIVTFGTSVCYYLKETDEVIGNCHKEPSDLYFTRRARQEEILECWNKLLEKLRIIIPGLKVIFTVSPVRHLKNGFTGNFLSKAVLGLALEEICRDNNDAFYFPAYEILNDDLRDYRFYASDLTHPSEEAVEYLWEKFIDTFLDEKGKLYLKEGEAKVKSMTHRPKTGALGKLLRK